MKSVSASPKTTKRGPELMAASRAAAYPSGFGRGSGGVLGTGWTLHRVRPGPRGPTYGSRELDKRRLPRAPSMARPSAGRRRPERRPRLRAPGDAGSDRGGADLDRAATG